MWISVSTSSDAQTRNTEEICCQFAHIQGGLPIGGDSYTALVMLWQLSCISSISKCNIDFWKADQKALSAKKPE